MTRDKQLEIVHGTVTAIVAEIEAKIMSGKILYNWNGFELREYIVLLASRESLLMKHKTTANRAYLAKARDFKHDVKNFDL